MALRTTPFDATDHLRTEEAIEAFLSDAAIDGEPHVTDARAIVERARQRWSLTGRDRRDA